MDMSVKAALKLHGLGLCQTYLLDQDANSSVQAEESSQENIDLAQIVTPSALSQPNLATLSQCDLPTHGDKLTPVTAKKSRIEKQKKKIPVELKVQNKVRQPHRGKVSLDFVMESKERNKCKKRRVDTLFNKVGILSDRTGVKACLIIVDGTKVKAHFTDGELEAKVKPNLSTLLEAPAKIQTQDKEVDCKLIKSSRLKYFKKGPRVEIVYEQNENMQTE